MLRSVNPYTREVLGEYPRHSDRDVLSLLSSASKAFERWRKTEPKKRAEYIQRVGELLIEKKEELARLATLEMGKPITQSRQEVEKCARCCHWYADHAEEYLRPELIPTEYGYSAIHSDPLGIWLAVMPWNFPFWQVIRCAVPAIVAGNVVVLKHASNVTGCALALEAIFREADKKALFTVVRISTDQVADIIRHPQVRGISLTGSEAAGRIVATQSAHALKPVVLELGGSNAFIVMPDADLDKALADAVTGRFQNNGQSCIAAKRILLHEEIADEFNSRLEVLVRQLETGDPLNERTYIGPLARAEFAETLQRQVQSSLREGAQLRIPLKTEDAMFTPTLLTQATSGMVCMQEELFGPVAVTSRFQSLEEAITVSNSTRFGLGVSVYTADTASIIKSASRFEDGALFLNHIVLSDPRLPFGGTKSSGFGRELGREGLLEFVNRKTVVLSGQI